jgi:nitrite reductase/ring-hydroxylating ferredoxin subunit
LVFIVAAKLSELPVGSMKHVEIDGREILLTNEDGKIWATDDRCGHMSAPLSKGTLQGNIIECPLHHARFDVVTGRTLKEGHHSGVSGAVVSITKLGGIMEGVKTYDLKTYEVVIDGDMIKVKIDRMTDR